MGLTVLSDVANVVQERLRADFYKTVSEYLINELEKYKEKELEKLRRQAELIMVSIMTDMSQDIHIKVSMRKP